MRAEKPVVIITGATDGIGLELARLWHSRTDRLLLIGRRDYAETALAGWHPERHYCRVDLSLPAAERALGAWLDRLGIARIDLLVHNAAIAYWGRLEDQGGEAIERMLNLNLRTPIAVTHYLLPLLLSGRRAGRNGRLQGRAKVLFVGSVAAWLPIPESAVYVAAKAGLEQFGRNLAHELAGRIDVAVLHPGATATGIFRKGNVDPERLRGTRMMSPQRVARTIMRARRELGHWVR